MPYAPLQTVESATGPTAAGATSVAATITTLAVGNSVVGRIQWEGGDSTPTVSDSAGNTYVVGSPQFSNGTIRMAHYYLLSAANGGSSVVVTASFAADSRTWRHLIATRGSTLASALSVTFPADITNPGSATDALACPSINISTAPAVIIAHALDLDLGGQAAVGTNYTDIGTALGNTRVEYRTFASTSASEVATFTSAFGSHTFSYGAMAFTEAAAAQVGQPWQRKGAMGAMVSM